MAEAATRILGIDPGLRITGFGIIDRHGSKLSYVSSGCVKTDESASLPERVKTPPSRRLSRRAFPSPNTPPCR